MQRVVEINYGGMQTSSLAADFELQLTFSDDVYRILCGSSVRAQSFDIANFWYDLEKTVSIELEMLRQDLLFVHGGVVAREDQAVVLVGESGAGKSTTTWALLQKGFVYGSDELAPIDADGFVEPYPHALCLKRRPPEPYVLPDCSYSTGATIHVPIHETDIELMRAPARVNYVLFTRYDPSCSSFEMRSLSAGESAARVYANALNQLAHKKQGLTLIAGLVQQAECYEIVIGDLPSAVDRIEQLLSRGGDTFGGNDHLELH